MIKLRSQLCQPINKLFKNIKVQHIEKQKYQQLDGRDRNENKGKELLTPHTL